MSSNKTNSSAKSDKVIVPQCKMKRQRFNNKQATTSQIGGGKAFRESHVGSAKKPRTDKELIRSFASKIKANSLSDIESINSAEENDDSYIIAAPRKSFKQDQLDVSTISCVIQVEKPKQIRKEWQNKLVPQLVVIEEIHRQPPLQTDLRI